MPSEKDGVMIILSSPSGAGKTTLVKKLSTENNELYGSVKPTEISKIIHESNKIEKVLEDHGNENTVEIANDNSDGQIVLSGKNVDLEKLIEVLKDNNIKNIKLPVSAPFHCKLMNKATEVMKKEIAKVNFQNSNISLISNVTANEIADKNELKELLVKQVENRVRWRESVINMIDKNINQFIEIGPGKVLSGLIKRINKTVKINTINNEIDIKDLNI